MSAPERPDSNKDDSTHSLDAALDAVASEAPSNVGDDWRTLRAKLEFEVREANDRALRSQAELENFRKRSRREMEDERRYASLPLIRDLLNVMDNLDRAMESAEKNHNLASLLEGVKMVAVQFQMYLEQHGCKRIPAAGAAFDPHQHEAVAQEPSVDVESGLVTRVARHGYQLHDRVVRPSQVLVSTGAPTNASGDKSPGA